MGILFVQNGIARRLQLICIGRLAIEMSQRPRQGKATMALQKLAITFVMLTAPGGSVICVVIRERHDPAENG